MAERGRGRPVVVKIGTSSLTSADGHLDDSVLERLAGEVVAVKTRGRPAVVVSSGAVTAGLAIAGVPRPSAVPDLQALSAIGQIELVHRWRVELARHDVIAAQVLLTQHAFRERHQYLQARTTFARLLAMGAVPVVNENDAVTADELPFGDNDRLAALVAHLVGADTLVLLTDTPGLFTADPRHDQSASLIEEIIEVDHELERVAGRGSDRGRGGMASKLAAAKIAAWTGVRTIIADAAREDVVGDAVDGADGVGTVLHPHDRRLPARKLWIAFATGSAGTITVDRGARRALTDGNRSLLPAGVRRHAGIFDVGDAVEVADEDGAVFAKGLVQMSSSELAVAAGRRTSELGDGVPHETIHRDDLVVLPR
jgi:glutamate 5-kinase